MKDVKITKSDKNETVFTINENIKVTLVAENFNKNGEMIVEFDEDKISEEEASKTVNKYFELLIANLEKRKNNTTILNEIKEKTDNM